MEKLNNKAGRIWDDSLRGCGVCLTAFSSKHVGSVGFMESFGALFLWIPAVPAVPSPGPSV